MATQQYIAGYLSDLEVDGNSFQPYTQTARLSRARNALEKPVLGQEFPVTIGGQKSGSLDVSGHVTVEAVPLLEAAYNNADPVAFVFAPGDVAGATDAGSYAGTGIVTAFNWETDAADEVKFDLSLQLDANPVYTPATP